VTIGSGVTAGGTLFSVSGGKVTMNNSTAITTAALTGGSTTLNGPPVTTVNFSAGTVSISGVR